SAGVTGRSSVGAGAGSVAVGVGALVGSGGAAIVACWLVALASGSGASVAAGGDVAVGAGSSSGPEQATIEGSSTAITKTRRRRLEIWTANRCMRLLPSLALHAGSARRIVWVWRRPVRRGVARRLVTGSGLTAEGSHDLLGGQHQREALAQHLQLRLLQRRVVGGGDVAAEDDVETALVGLPGGGAAAEVGERACDHDRVAPQVPQDRLERRVIEGAVGGLVDHDLVGARLQLVPDGAIAKQRAVVEPWQVIAVRHPCTAARTVEIAVRRREHGVDHWDIVRPRALDERLEPADLARRLRHPVRTPARLDELNMNVDDEQHEALVHVLLIRPFTRVLLP